MKISIKSLLQVSCLSFALFAGEAAIAQDQIIMRRQIAPANPSVTPAPAPTPTPTPGAVTYEWEGQGWTASTVTCGENKREQQEYSCIKVQDGTRTLASESSCTEPKPSGSREVTPTASDNSSCVYAWDDSAAWGEWNSQCSPTATRTRDVVCRDNINRPVGDGKCTEPKPESSQTMSIMTECPGLLSNSGFEASMPGGWLSEDTPYSVATDARFGTKSLLMNVKYTLGGYRQSLSQNYSIVAGDQITIGFWCKSTAGSTGHIFLKIEEFTYKSANAGHYKYFTKACASSYGYHSESFTWTGPGGTHRIMLHLAGSGHPVYLDHVYFVKNP